MLQGRVERYRDRIRREFVKAFREHHTPHQIGVSFAIGIFITAMPTGGLGVGLFFVLAYHFSWISKPAIFASVAVLNPVIKPAVYVASLQVGAFVLDTGGLIPDEGTIAESALLATKQLLIGNLLIALLLAALGYLVAFHLTVAHRRRTDETGDSWVESTLLGLFRR